MDHLIGAPGRGALGRGVQLSGAYDPRIESAGGLTVDTLLGPVDLVAVGHILAGRRVPLTPADRAYVLERVPTDYPSLTAAAAALGITRDSVERAATRARARVGAAA
jgi:hypothetical protein